MVLGKLPVPGRPTDLDKSRARACCACSRCGWGCLDIFFLVYHFSFLSPSVWETARYRLKYCLKGPLSPKQPINQHQTKSNTWAANVKNSNVSKMIQANSLLLNCQMKSPCYLVTLS